MPMSIWSSFLIVTLTPLDDQLHETIEITYFMGYNDGDGHWSFNGDSSQSIKIDISGIINEKV